LSKKLFITAVCLVLALVTAAALAGCSSPTKTPTTQTGTATSPATSEPDYAHAIADAMMKGLSNDNLEEYIRYGDAQFKAAVTQEILDAAAIPLKDKYGEYESITYISTETSDQFTIFHYRAKFSQDEIGLRMVFDQDHLVAGQFFEALPGS
jgi:hypothetical protein